MRVPVSDVRSDNKIRPGVMDWRRCAVCQDFAANCGIGDDEQWHPDCYIHQGEPRDCDVTGCDGYGYIRGGVFWGSADEATGVLRQAVHVTRCPNSAVHADA